MPSVRRPFRPLARGIVFVCLSAVALAHGVWAGEIWRLGEKDGSCKDFRMAYYAWEYGHAAWLKKHPAMDHATHTFNYTVKGPGVQKTVDIPQELATTYECMSMDADEIVNALALHWTETAAGNRLLKVDLSGYTHWNGNGLAGLELQLPDGRKKVYNLPKGSATDKKDCFPMEMVFPVTPGANTATIRIVSLAKHYRIRFDAIALETTDRACDLVPVLETRTSGFSNIFHPGDRAELVLDLVNATSGEAAYTVRDVTGAEVARGTARFDPATAAGGVRNTARAVLPCARKGWFEVESTCGAARARVSYCVTEPPEDVFVPDSRFGCHAVAGDGYRLHANPFMASRAEIKNRRAWLGGAKWARLHYLSMASREPERGRRLFDDLDAKVARAHRYKMHVLFNVLETPLWNSPSKDMKLTCCGSQRFRHHPPVDETAWGDFMADLAARFKGRVDHFELGNEPGRTSAFWMNGDPADFGRFLKAGYLGAKRGNPACTVYPGAPLTGEFLEAAVTAVRGGEGWPYYDVLSAHYEGGASRFSELPATWQRLSAKLGRGTRMINSEDMSWHGDTPAAVAASMVKLHVRDAARGILRTFAFQVFDNLAGTYGTFFDVHEAPRPSFAAYRAMTHRLEHAVYVGDLSTAEYEAYVFDRRGTPVIVFWNALSVPYTMRLALGADAAVRVDGMDNETPVRADKGVFACAAGDLPQYLEGGDWTAIRRAIAARPADPFEGKGSNPAGQNVALPRWTKEPARATPYRGRRFFTAADKVKVRYGERYVLSAQIRGAGSLHGISRLHDAAGKEVHPCRQGLNCLGWYATDVWKRHHQVFTVMKEDAATFHLTLVANFADAYSNAVIELKDVRVARLSERCSEMKALNRAAPDAPIVLDEGWKVFAHDRVGEPVWKGTNDLSAVARVTCDAACVRLRFEVTDDTYDPPADDARPYMKDSIQFAFDPLGTGRDMTEFQLYRTCDGRCVLRKDRNYTTPELPDNLTRNGVVKAAEIAWNRTATGYVFDVTIPLRELYPLKADAAAFGFNFLVNDADGGARKYIEWAGGIGSGKDPRDLGVLVRGM